MLIRLAACFVIFFVLLTSLADANESIEKIHTSHRCVCKCPHVDANMLDAIGLHPGRMVLTHRRSVYINASVMAGQCNCPNVVFPYLVRPGGVVHKFASTRRSSPDQNDAPTESELMALETSFCPRCDCQYEVRNLTIIRVVVIGVLVCISGLIAVMIFSFCIEQIRFAKQMPQTSAEGGRKAFWMSLLKSASSGGRQYEQHFDDQQSNNDVPLADNGTNFSPPDLVLSATSAVGAAASTATSESGQPSRTAERVKSSSPVRPHKFWSTLESMRREWLTEVARQRETIYGRQALLN